MTVSFSDCSIRTNKIDTIRGEYKPLGPELPFQGPHIFIIRNGESIADVFPDWIQRCELDVPFYVPFDLNMPISLPRRNHMKEAYAQDPPLSEIGKITTQMVARELVLRKATPILAIYCAPNLVSLQTAYEISHYLGERCGPIRVNADLSTNRSCSGHWLTQHQLIDLGYKVDRDYEPLISMDSAESVESMSTILRGFIKDISTLEGSVIIVSDPLAVKCISDSANGIFRLYGEEPDKAYEIAETSFPPCSTCTLKMIQNKHEILAEPSPVTIRAITGIGITSAQDRQPDMGFV